MHFSSAYDMALTGDVADGLGVWQGNREYERRYRQIVGPGTSVQVTVRTSVQAPYHLAFGGPVVGEFIANVTGTIHPAAWSCTARGPGTSARTARSALLASMVARTV